MTEQPDITESLRAHRDVLALSGHEQLDAIEAAAAQGKCDDVHEAVDRLHTLLDVLAGIVVVPDFTEIAQRLDCHAAELFEHGQYRKARDVVETAEAFARRQMQIATGANPPVPTTENHFYCSSQKDDRDYRATAEIQARSFKRR